MNEEASVRLDVWLWAARWFRTRSLAKEAIEAGRVLADGQPCKRSRPVRPGQKLEIHRAGERYEIQVLALSTRGGAPEAARLYRESDGSRQRAGADGCSARPSGPATSRRRGARSAPGA